MKKRILISTGGSGGHVIPATILHEHLKNNFEVYITTDIRGKKFLSEEDFNIKIIDVPKLFSNIFLFPINFYFIFLLTIKSIFFLKKKNIDTLISTGGYMSLPLCIAALILNIKIYLFEPNMVLGRANKFFLRFCEKVFCYSSELQKFPKKFIDKIVLINPLVRKDFYSKKIKEILPIEQNITLLIIGGSQGAKLFDTELKNAIITLSKKYKLKIFHQTSISNFKDLRQFYIKNNIHNQLFDFDKKIFEFISKANLCITRGGASTLSELIFLDIPSLVIPYPAAIDDHQYQNALFYKNKNCCWIMRQDRLKENILGDNLINIVEKKDDYVAKKKSMQNFSYKNTWNNINQKLINIINEN